MGLEVQVIPRDAGQLQFALVPHIRRIAGVGVTFAVNEDAVLPPAGGDQQAAEAAEKNTPTEPKEMLDWNGITAYECENCGCDVFETQNYCPYCGQRLKWEE